MSIHDMLIIVMSQSRDIDDYTDLIKIEHEHDEFFLQFLINLFVAHHAHQTSTVKIKASTSEIKNESSENFTKLINISDIEEPSLADLNKDFITFKKSQNIVLQDDTNYE